MIQLIVLLSVFVLGVVGKRLRQEKLEFAFPARLAMAAMLMFTAVGHFIYAEGMRMMIPSFLPLKKEIVYTTGVLEIVFAILIVIRATQKVAGRLLIIYFLSVLPANIYPSTNHVGYQLASYEGPGIEYSWFRIPLQLFFITRVYFHVIKKSDDNVTA